MGILHFERLQDVGAWGFLGYALLAISLYAISLAVYRLYLHPLAHFPGPKLAAATGWYETFFDVFKPPGGQYYLKLQDFHAEYGPIIRISPDELQIDDWDFYDTIYASGGGKRHRWEQGQAGNGAPGSMASVGPYEHHRMRRSALSSFFSKAAIVRLEDRVQGNIAILCEKLERRMEAGEIVRLDMAFSALTLDIISEYSFGESYQNLQQPDFNQQYLLDLRTGLEGSQGRKHFPWTLTLLPKFIARNIPAARIAFELQDKLCTQIETIKAASSGQNEVADAPKQSMFSDILHSKLPAAEKETLRVRDEALVILVAGNETSARALSTAMFHLLSNPDILDKVRRELDEAIPDPNAPVPLSEVESLPYLGAILKETLRIAQSVVNRSLMYADTPLHYKQWQIPPKTPMCSTNIALQLMDETIFPDPRKFAPERWLGDSPATKKALRMFHPFGKGPRMCLGQNLAWAELYLTTSTILRKFDFRLFDTIRERDIDVVRDCFAGLPSPEAKGVRVEILGLRS